MRILTLITLCISTVLLGSTPKWYVSLPDNTQAMYYAVGEGKDIGEATKEALSYIATQVNVTISSSFQQDTSVSQLNGNEYIASSSRAQLKSYTKSINFNNFKVIKNEIKDGLAYVLISVDKVQWIKEKNSLLKLLNMKLNKLYIDLDNQPISMRLRDALEMKIKIAQARNFIRIISAIDPSFFKKNHLSIYRRYEMQIDEIVDSVVVFIDVDDSDFNSIKDAIYNYLSKQKIKLSFTKIVSDKLITIKIDGNMNYKKSYGNFTVHGNISYIIKDGDIITSIAMKEIEQNSLIDYKSAQMKLQKKMESILSEEGLFNYIGLN